MLGIPTSSAIVRFLLVALFGALVSQVVIPLIFPAWNDGLKWLWTIILSIFMWFLSGFWIGRVRKEGQMRERYK